MPIGPKPGDVEMGKHRYSSFTNTNLEFLLRARPGIDTLVICGLTTECCVETAVRDAFKRPRRTQIVGDDTGEISAEELVDDEPLVVTVTARGYLQAKSARGRGAKVADPGDKDAAAHVVDTSALGALLFFTTHGRAYRAACHDLPKQRLTAIPNLFTFSDGERVIAVLDAGIVGEHDNVVFVTALGTVKRTPIEEFTEASGRRDGLVAMKLAPNDRVVSVHAGWDDFETLVVTRDGQAIRFAESEVRPVGRSAGGIRAIKLRGDDVVVGACAVAHEEVVVVASDNGHAKRVRADEFPVQARGGSGVRVAKPDRKRGALLAVVPSTAQIAFVSDDGVAVVGATDIKLQSREGALPRVAAVGDDGPVRSVVGVASRSGD